MLEQLKAGHTAEMVTMINKQPKWNDTVRGRPGRETGAPAGAANSKRPVSCASSQGSVLNAR
jgi:hypothetical protein